MMASNPAETKVLPSGPNETSNNPLPCPFKAPSGLPVSASQMLMSPFPWAEAVNKDFPSGEKTSAWTFGSRTGRT